MTQTSQAIIMITGLSGAGRSSTLDQLEDFGFEAIDNLPIRLIETVVRDRTRPMALGLDVRNRDFQPTEILDILRTLREEDGETVFLLFLDCDDEELLTRYNKTKRAHPMGEKTRLAETITRERALLSPLRSAADFVLDTTKQSVWDHRRRLQGLGIDLPYAQLRIRLISFSYGRGIPRDADQVFDVRFLQNPHYTPELQPYNGQDQAVADFVCADPNFAPYFAQLQSLLDLTLSNFQKEGKSYLTLAIGCTGGQHRSVAVTEALGQWLYKAGHHIQIFHRELAP